MSAWPDDQNDETPGVCVFSPNSLLLGFYLTKKSWPHSLAAPLNSVAGLCGWVPWLGSKSRPCPPLVLCGWALFCVQALSSLVLCGWALCPGLVLLLSLCPPGLCAGLCVQALSSSCPLLVLLNSVLGSVSGSCPPLVLVLAAPLNSVAGLCGPVYWRGVWPNK